MQSAGVWMLLALALTTACSGLPVWALLLGISSVSAVIGVYCGVMDLQVLGAMPARVMGLLESDILQALPLYVFVGVLLRQLAIAHNVQAVLARWGVFVCGDKGSAYALSVLGVGAFVAPMNGSVASSASLLTALVQPQSKGANAAKTLAWVSIAATIGVVVPPSLVLILLGDTMMRAHTEALNMPGSVLQGAHIINTQDVFHAALLPAVALLVLWAWIACRQARGERAIVLSASGQQAGVAVCALACIGALLWGVFAGWMFAVEAAASACVLLVLGTIVARAINMSQWRDVLVQSLALSGALLALLVGATVFSLVFRLFGTDAWLAQRIAQSPLPPQVTAALVLTGVALCAWVLDAFEMIFVIIPTIAPPLISMLGDAQQVAVLLLLVLQLGFLLPPMGYAVMLAQAAIGPALGLRDVLRALRPYLVVQLVMILLVFTAPQLVHLLDETQTLAAPETDEDLVRRMQEMARPAE